MLELHFYGKLRRFASDTDPTSESTLSVEFIEGDTVGSVVDRIGISPEDLGSNMFVNGRYADRSSSLKNGDRIGLFPNDMQLLYKWYFAPKTDSGAPRDSAGAPNGDSAGTSEKEEK